MDFELTIYFTQGRSSKGQRCLVTEFTHDEPIRGGFSPALHHFPLISFSYSFFFPFPFLFFSYPVPFSNFSFLIQFPSTIPFLSSFLLLFLLSYPVSICFSFVIQFPLLSYFSTFSFFSYPFFFSFLL